MSNDSAAVQEIVDEFDPLEVYSLEDFIAEEEILDEFGRKIEEKLKVKIGEESATTQRRRHVSGIRTVIPRNRDAAHDDLVANYFSANPVYPPEIFRRRFRMNRPLFEEIVRRLGEWSPYFTQQTDVVGRAGHSPCQMYCSD